MRKNCKEYLVTRTYGKTVTVKDPFSEISLEVAQGVRAVVMQSINMDFQLLQKVTAVDECLATPVVQFHTTEEEKQRVKVKYKYKMTIPHYLCKYHNLSSIKVKYGNLKRPLQMKEIQKGDPHYQSLPYYEVSKKHITIYAHHFCDVVCTSVQKICTSKILAIPFGWIGRLDSDADTHMKVKTYMCNYLYNNSDLKMVRIC